MAWKNPVASRAGVLARRRNSLLRRVFHPKDSIPKRVQRVYSFGAVEYDPSVFTPVLGYAVIEKGVIRIEEGSLGAATVPSEPNLPTPTRSE